MPCDYKISLLGKVVERRGERRRVTRLNWGKTLSIKNEFLSECLIANLTSQGACLRIVRYVDIPGFFLLYEDASGIVRQGEVIWRKGLSVGCRFTLMPIGARIAVARRMRAKYYSL